MMLYMHAEGTVKIPGENMLFDRLKRISKEGSGAVFSKIAVIDSTDHVRYVLHTFSETEHEGITRQIEDAGFSDILIVNHEEEDEDGDIEYWAETHQSPDFFAIYRKGPHEVVRNKATGTGDPD